MEAVLDPDSTAEDIILAAARGIVTGVFINLLCKIKGLGPALTKVFMAVGLGQQVQSIIHYTKEGKYDLAITTKRISPASIGSGFYPSVQSEYNLRLQVSDSSNRLCLLKAEL